MSLRNVPLWTTPQRQTTDVSFLDFLLNRSGTEINLKLISNEFCDIPCRHARFPLLFLSCIHECGTFEGSIILFLLLCSCDITVLGLQANLKETIVVKIAVRVEATSIRSCSNE